MGLFDRLRSAVGGSDESAADGADDDDEAWVPTGRTERPSGDHGSHWGALTDDDEAIRGHVIECIEEGDPIEGRPIEDADEVVGYRRAPGAVGTTVVTTDGNVRTAYPTLEGVTQPLRLDEVRAWRNGVEAQLRGELGDAELGLFDVDYFAREPYEPGEAYDVSLAALAYGLNPAEDEVLTDESGERFSTAGVAAYVPMEDGDVDDYLFQTTVTDVVTLPFGDVTVARMRVPLFRVDGVDVDVALYAAERATDGWVPEVGDDVEGVCWLQGTVV